jgi:formylglycine-generating enzyme required for sulfatase activity
VRTPRRRAIVAALAGTGLLAAAVGGAVWYRTATAVDPRLIPGSPIGGVPVAIAPFDARTAREHQERWAQHLGVPVTWTNSVGMEFVLIPPGEYTRGVPEAEAARLFELDQADPWNRIMHESSTPAHRVRLTHAVYLAKTETTQGQFRQVTGDTVGFFRMGMPGEKVLTDSDTSKLPAENLGWTLITKFCDSLSAKDGFDRADGRYRLPTEAEWTFACMAGSPTPYWYGPEPDQEGAFEVSALNADRRTQPVASYQPNPFGLYDMQGNVREFVNDWWSVSEYKQYADRWAIDPKGATDDGAGSQQRVICGAAFNSPPEQQSWMVRGMFRPEVWVNSIGFRVAIPAEAVARKLKGGDPQAR